MYMVMTMIPKTVQENVIIFTLTDLAKAHVAAMTHPHANGKRFILAERCMWLFEVNKILRKHGYKKAPIRQAPNLLNEIFSSF